MHTMPLIIISSEVEIPIIQKHHLSFAHISYQRAHPEPQKKENTLRYIKEKNLSKAKE